MRKILTIIAATILLFGCTKEETANTKVNNYKYQITSTGGAYDIVYLNNGGVTINAKGGGWFQYEFAYAGTKYLYLSAKYSKPDHINKVTLKILRNDVIISERTSTTSATLSGTY